MTRSPPDSRAARPLMLAGAFYLLTQAVSRTYRMNTKLSELLQGIPVQSVTGDPHSPISGLCSDSRRVTPGTLFFAYDGLRTDGNFYIEEAVHRGAAAIVSERPGRVPPRAAYVQVANIRRVMADIARRFHGFPERDLELIAVTGTNGKTTVTTLLKHLLEAPGEPPVGLLGTVAYMLGDRTLPAYRTTPEATDLHALLAQMRDAGCTRALMEVSSHGIEQERVRNVPFRIAAYLNLTRDHIDYHGSMEEYFSVKRRLFTGETGTVPEIVVLNRDDPYAGELESAVPRDRRIITFGLAKEADIYAADIEMQPTGTRFRIHTPDGDADLQSPLLGRHNVSNVLAAFAIASASGASLSILAKRLRGFPGVPGRLEKVEAGQDFNVLVDYAHTDDALRNVLAMLRPITPGRLLVVFGCGGNRDRAKRPLMTAAVLADADFAWATSDNPRSEAVADIFADMREAVSADSPIMFVEDRRRAIHLALLEARSGDTVLIAGKGHETFQEFADSVVPFDDCRVARELLSNRLESTRTD